MAKVAQYNLNELTKQEVFTLARNHLIEQGVPSVSEGRVCLYNSGELCCAAAPFLPSYDNSMEGSDWRTLRKDGFLEGFTDEFDNLITELQDAHDNAAFGETYKLDRAKYMEKVNRHLAHVAIKHGLEIQE